MKREKKTFFTFVIFNFFKYTKYIFIWFLIPSLAHNRCSRSVPYECNKNFQRPYVRILRFGATHNIQLFEYTYNYQSEKCFFFTFQFISPLFLSCFLLIFSFLLATKRRRKRKTEWISKSIYSNDNYRACIFNAKRINNDDDDLTICIYLLPHWTLSSRGMIKWKWQYSYLRRVLNVTIIQKLEPTTWNLKEKK